MELRQWATCKHWHLIKAATTEMGWGMPPQQQAAPAERFTVCLTHLICSSTCVSCGSAAARATSLPAACRALLVAAGGGGRGERRGAAVEGFWLRAKLQQAL